jgi:hypothetical protein
VFFVGIQKRPHLVKGLLQHAHPRGRGEKEKKGGKKTGKKNLRETHRKWAIRVAIEGIENHPIEVDGRCGGERMKTKQKDAPSQLKLNGRAVS